MYGSQCSCSFLLSYMRTCIHLWNLVYGHLARCHLFNLWYICLCVCLQADYTLSLNKYGSNSHTTDFLLNLSEKSFVEHLYWYVM